MNVFRLFPLSETQHARSRGALLCALAFLLSLASTACQSEDDANDAATDAGDDSSTDGSNAPAGSGGSPTAGSGGNASGSGSAPGSGGASSGSGGTGDERDGEECGTRGLTLPAPIAKTTTSAPLPPPSGGTIQPGRYVFSEWRTLEPSPSEDDTFAAVFELDSDGNGRGIQQSDSEPPFAFAMTWQEWNGYLVLTYTCPEDKVGPGEGRRFSAHGSTLEFTTDNDSLMIYSRVP